MRTSIKSNKIFEINTGYKEILNSRLVYTIISLIFITIFYQQVFVINIGSSFKIYELLSMILLFTYLFLDKKNIYSRYSLCLFIFFIVAPLPGNILNIFNPTKSEYYTRYPEAKAGIRFNIWISPFLIYIYYLFNWIVINYIIGSERVYKNRQQLIRVFVISGTLVAVYALYGFFLIRRGAPDLIPSFLDYRNSKPATQPRPAGFSIEPGTYILILSWVILYLAFIPGLFRKSIQRLCLGLNVLVLLLTQSSAILAFVVAIYIYLLFFTSYKIRIRTIIVSAIGAVGLMVLINSLGLGDLIEYIAVTKIKNFFSSTEVVDIQDSGEIRSYTSQLGLKVFRDHPFFGVGGGNSYYYLWKYDGLVPSKILLHDMAPQNTHVKVLAELGIFGYTFFLAFFFLLFRNIILKMRKKIHVTDPIISVGFIGALNTFGMLLSIYPEYSLFLWVNLALIVNYLYHSNKERKALYE